MFRQRLSPSGPFDPAGSAAIWVNGDTGHDLAPGTETAPVQTLARALELVRQDEAATIRLAPSTSPYDGTPLTRPWARSAPLILRGDDHWSEVVPPFEASGTQILLTATTDPGWASDEQLGALIEVVSSATASLVGERRVVARSTSDTLEPLVALTAPVPGGTMVRLVRPAVEITMPESSTIEAPVRPRFPRHNYLSMRGLIIRVAGISGWVGAGSMTGCIVSFSTTHFWSVGGALHAVPLDELDSRFYEGNILERAVLAGRPSLQWSGDGDLTWLFGGGSISGAAFLGSGGIRTTDAGFTVAAAARVQIGALVNGARARMYLDPGGGAIALTISRSELVLNAPLEVLSGNGNILAHFDSFLRTVSAAPIQLPPLSGGVTSEIRAHSNSTIEIAGGWAQTDPPPGGFVAGLPTNNPQTAATLAAGAAVRSGDPTDLPSWLSSGDGSLIYRSS